MHSFRLGERLIIVKSSGAVLAKGWYAGAELPLEKANGVFYFEVNRSCHNFLGPFFRGRRKYADRTYKPHYPQPTFMRWEEPAGVTVSISIKSDEKVSPQKESNVHYAATTARKTSSIKVGKLWITAYEKKRKSGTV